jgi:endonuclease III
MTFWNKVKNFFKKAGTTISNVIASPLGKLATKIISSAFGVPGADTVIQTSNDIVQQVMKTTDQVKKSGGGKNVFNETIKKVVNDKQINKKFSDLIKFGQDYAKEKKERKEKELQKLSLQLKNNNLSQNLAKQKLEILKKNG